MPSTSRRSSTSLSAIDDLSLAVDEGEIFGLVGPDGAGKTTTMRLLTSIMDPDGGEAWVAGHHVVREAEAVKAEIGYMSQRFGLYADLTVMENLDFYADIYNVPRKGRDERIERLLAFSNLTPFKRRLAGNLSGGMKQKLGLACTLVHTPRVLFLDEPTNGVDPVSRRDFWRILYQLLREKVTIFVSTAYLDEAERCNRLALIHQGRMLACGTPDEVKQLMRGTILEIRTAEPRQAAAVLRQQFPAASVGLFGDRVHFVGTDGQGEAEQVGKTPARRRPAAAGRADHSADVGGRVRFGDRGEQRRAAAERGARSTAARTVAMSRRRAMVCPRSPSPGLSLCSHYAHTAVVVDNLERRFGSFMAVNRVSFAGQPRRDLRLPGAQRGGQIDHDPHALRNPLAHRRPRQRGRLRYPHAARANQGQRRLHEPEVLALPGPDRRGEHRLLRRHLPHRRPRKRPSGSSG